MDYSVEMFAQVRKLKAISTLKDKLIIPFAAPKVVANLNRTYEELLDKFEITNPELRELMETFTSFAGVPPGRASSILTAGGMLSSISRCFRPYGYFDEFPSSMAKLFQERGGEIRLSAKVDSLPVENNRAAGLRVEGDDRSIRADRFVSTLDPNILVHDIVGDEAFPPAYVKKLKDTVMSSSSLNIALGLDDGIDMTGMDLDYPYNVVSTGLGTTDALFDAFLEGRNGFTSDRFHMAVICPSLTTGGKTTVTLRVVPIAPAEWILWRKKRPATLQGGKRTMGGFLHRPRREVHDTGIEFPHRREGYFHSGHLRPVLRLTHRQSL